jgi:uncharacterized protein YejL (UPF0352 family)
MCFRQSARPPPTTQLVVLLEKQTAPVILSLAVLGWLALQLGIGFAARPVVSLEV